MADNREVDLLLTSGEELKAVCTIASLHDNGALILQQVDGSEVIVAGGHWVSARIGAATSTE